MRNPAPVVPSKSGHIAGLLLLLMACSGEPGTDDESMTRVEDAPNLFDVVWQIEDIDNGGVIDRSHITMQLLREGRIAGSTGCNQYFGSVTVEAGTIEVDGVGSTRKACLPAIMQQEQRFLQALQDLRRYEIDGDLARLYDEAGDLRLRMIRTDEKPWPVSQSQPQDLVDPAVQQSHRFACGDGPDFEVRFAGPETVILTLPDGDHTLQRERTASGAKYSGGGIIYWNKGDEALLEIDGVRHTCARLT
jgi:heat shock protein HslJ/membrane-bound inhibitor of C-type lysozyme